MEKTDAVSIGLQSVDALADTQGVGDLYRLYAVAQRDGVDFRVTWMPDDLPRMPKAGFDPVYQRTLFDRGYEMALGGEAWRDAPPGIGE